MTKRTLITTAAAIFAAGTFATAAYADGGVKCHGTNACKGQGFTETKDAVSCSNQGGKVM